jgi:hypothetical protein
MKLHKRLKQTNENARSKTYTCIYLAESKESNSGRTVKGNYIQWGLGNRVEEGTEITAEC